MFVSPRGGHRTGPDRSRSEGRPAAEVQMEAPPDQLHAAASIGARLVPRGTGIPRSRARAGRSVGPAGRLGSTSAR